jgi:hypothetical protein
MLASFIIGCERGERKECKELKKCPSLARILYKKGLLVHIAIRRLELGRVSLATFNFCTSY